MSDRALATDGPDLLPELTTSEYDVVGERDGKWVRFRTVTDVGEARRTVEDFRWGNPSGSVTWHVVRRDTTVVEVLDDALIAPEAVTQ